MPASPEPISVARTAAGISVSNGSRQRRRKGGLIGPPFCLGEARLPLPRRGPALDRMDVDLARPVHPQQHSFQASGRSGRDRVCGSNPSTPLMPTPSNRSAMRSRRSRIMTIGSTQGLNTAPQERLRHRLGLGRRARAGCTGPATTLSPCVPRRFAQLPQLVNVGTFETELFCSLCDRLDRRGEQS